MSLQQAFEDQAVSCERLDSPFMGQLLRILAKVWQHDTQLGKAMAAYSGDIGPVGHSLPLRIAGGLHALVLSGQSEALRLAYPPHDVDYPTLSTAVASALKQHEAFLLDWTKNPPQTNEVRRSAALIAGARVALSYFQRPIILSELGASGGLNLMWDRFALDIGSRRFGANNAALVLSPNWDGPLPPPATIEITERADVDLNPLNPNNPDDLLCLKAYLWADQPHHLALTQAAAATLDTVVEQGDAIDWLEQRLAQPKVGHLHLIQNTVAWQYFPKAAQAKGLHLIEAAGALATPDHPLAWLSMENDGDATGGVGAAIMLRIWPGNVTLQLGRADFHGRWVQWTYQS
jgi:hypothetical protein|tara:strand:+ start:3545 stop:4585 length:1041 start_codon:yes stop_codon:yes gene_type:complete